MTQRTVLSFESFRSAQYFSFISGSELSLNLFDTSPDHLIFSNEIFIFISFVIKVELINLQDLWKVWHLVLELVTFYFIEGQHLKLAG